MSAKISEESLSGSQNRRITWEGCSVLLDINDGDRVLFARLTASSKIKIGNNSCSLQPLIGCPFGSSFQVEVGGDGPFLSRVIPSTEGNNLVDKMDSQIMEERRDNRAIVDNNTAQTLTGEDIDDMRRKGATGDEIVEALIANSATFEKKTAFSQEKYRIKKQKKYAPRVLLRRPFARSICEAYFEKHAEKIGFLRVDTLSLMLSLANVTVHSDVLVVDMLDGIVTGAVAERLGGTGYVCNTYCGITPYPINIVRMFNFSDETCKRILHASLAELRPTRVEVQHPLMSSKMPTEALSPSSAINLVSMDESYSGNMETATNVTTSPKSSKSIKAGEKAPLEAIKSWQENGFSRISLHGSVMGFLYPQRWVQIYILNATETIQFFFLQPLASCMHNLQIEKMAIGLQLSEPWLREYQVLPSRTHPHMQMSSSGGYLLSGIRITGTDQPQPN
ncbi:UNVERIFIED_CONTAM: tRNA (adenine(58)-N(1))-methyltransferase non-catalytic subunit trm6 [Sesamum radiatum]|uniref:tRNA (adenine(58)-N(1))-methyltransferase non-catalytic subunit TRM6 n=1 Tax=Sesamum radiatum TaxID=300843 RepID=A0AAW2M644_SESRA